MSIHIHACAEFETIIVTTRSSVYELIVLPGHEGVLVRGGSHFPEFRRALFLGSTAEDASFAPSTIDIGRRLQFICGDRVFITSAVESLSLATCECRLKACAAELSGAAVRAASFSSPDVLGAAS
jgi:hypothetical protein